MTYGERLFTLTALTVAPWDGAAYGSPVAVGDRQQLQVTPQMDTDEVKAGGVVVALLSVATHVTFTLAYARLQPAVLSVIATDSPTTSGSSPAAVTDFGTMGGGLPYFGVMGAFASEDGGNVLIGLPLCKLDSAPAPANDQNQFATYSVTGRGIANPASDSPGRLLVVRQYETAAALPADADAVDTFFGV
jgi:hypothetical protein